MAVVPRVDGAGYAVKVHELYTLLETHIGFGRGEDDVYVYFADWDDIGGHEGPVAPLFESHNWAVTDMSWTDDRDAFVTLSIAPEPESKETTT